jgi:hypothetical protein
MEELIMSNPHNHLFYQKFAEVRNIKKKNTTLFIETKNVVDLTEGAKCFVITRSELVLRCTNVVGMNLVEGR